MANVRKLMLYQLMRLQGSRMYSMKSWTRATVPNLASVQMKTHCQSKRTAVSDAATFSKPKLLDKFKEKIGIQGNLRYPQSYFLHSGCRLYLSATEAVLYNNVYDEISLPDTLMTWHKLVTLHIWLIMTRLECEGREGFLTRHHLVYAFLSDKKDKITEIGNETNFRFTNKDHDLLHEKFIASLMNYDEGLLGSDMELAGAIWRNVFDASPQVDPTHLELLVKYIRKQAMHLETISSEDMLTNGLIPFLPLYGNQVTEEIYNTLSIFRGSSKVG